MRTIRACAVLLFAGVAAGANAQGASEGVVKLPDQIEWKAPPVSPGPSTAVLYGDPSKPGEIGRASCRERVSVLV